jgi:hypothetical protein
MAKVARDLLFIKSTGVLIGELGPETDRESLNFEKFLIKSVELDPELGEYWYGDHDTGEIRSKVEKPVVTESYIKFDSNMVVHAHYPIHKQINIIIDMLDQSGLPKTEAFTRLKEYIDKVKAQHLEQITAYSSHPEAYTWVSEEEEHDIIDKKRRFE